jgi:probable F420-dependent oxidoreductase
VTTTERPTRIRLGVMVHADHLLKSPEIAASYCEALEGEGVESVWAPEHVAVADEYVRAFPRGSNAPMRSTASADRPDPLELLAWLAPQSTSLLLGTAVVIAPLHSPVTLAKRAATVDVLSQGRLLLGLGIGWQREEYEAIGVPFEGRGSRLEEAITVLRALWGDSAATHQGHSVRFENLWSRPRPVRGAIPIIAGGHSTGAIDRAGRIADGWFPFAIEPEEFARGAAQLHIAAKGRPVEITAWPGSVSNERELDLAYVQAYVDAGAARLLYQPQLQADDPIGSLRQKLRTYREEILGRLESPAVNDPVGPR